MSFLLYIAHQLKGNIVFLPLAAFSTNLLVYVVKPSALRGIMTIKYSYRKQPRQNSYRHMYQVYIYIVEMNNFSGQDAPRYQRRAERWLWAFGVLAWMRVTQGSKNG